MQFRWSFDSGGGHPCAMCQAQMAAKYLRAAVTEIGLSWTLLAMIGSIESGSVTTHKAKEWMSSKDAGSLCDSGTENMSQKT